ncbi:MAG: hypothetical protein ACPGGA_01505 [Balneolaceae bacterium]
MKTGLYNKYYKLGLEHFVNKNYFKLHRPNLKTDVFYIALMATIITVALIFS